MSFVKAQQLALDLPVEEKFEAEDFLVGDSNALAYGMLEQWPDWRDPVLLLVGPPGSGKTHLSTIWARRAGAERVSPDRINPSLMASIRPDHALLIEDMDQTRFDEASLFHMLNRSREIKCSIMLTARTSPSDWGLKTADLLSRLRLAPRIDLLEPDDGLLTALLVKFFVERQMVVDMQVVDFIKSRIDRSVSSLRDFVDALNREGLARRRRITKALAREVWKVQDQPAGDPVLPHL
jgi:chromosomal replication initiation ATPase DnaA